jgi:hypothetical protein
MDRFEQCPVLADKGEVVSSVAYVDVGLNPVQLVPEYFSDRSAKRVRIVEHEVEPVDKCQKAAGSWLVIFFERISGENFT